MDGLQDASKRALSFKIEKCDRQIASLSKAYGMAATSMEQMSIGDKIQDIQAQKQTLSVRMAQGQRHKKAFRRAHIQNRWKPDSSYGNSC